jgi:hypothetical protein
MRAGTSPIRFMRPGTRRAKLGGLWKDATKQATSASSLIRSSPLAASSPAPNGERGIRGLERLQSAADFHTCVSRSGRVVPGDALTCASKAAASAGERGCMRENVIEKCRGGIGVKIGIKPDLAGSKKTFFFLESCVPSSIWGNTWPCLAPLNPFAHSPHLRTRLEDHPLDARCEPSALKG